MMNEKLVLEKTKEFVKKELEDEGTGHDWWHIYRVTELAKTIAEKEGADLFICQMAALLHDLADDKVVGSEEEGLNQIKAWLEKHLANSEKVEAILHIAATISYKGGHGAKLDLLEAKVVQDADRVDEIGRASCREIE